MAAPPAGLVDVFRTGWDSWEEPQQQEEKQGAACKRRKAAADVTMDLAILDCPVCCHPLRSPIFQCTVGHTICSSCHDKLPEKCHFCSLPTVYSRCHMVENVVESIKVACSNVNHGCTARMTYYLKEEHEKGCPHAPCFCPETSCGFSGSTARLLEHFLGKHKWHSPKVTYNKAFQIRVHLGSTVLVGEDGHLFLVNMTLEPLGGVISVCCVQPHFTGSKFKCRLALSCTEPSYCQAMEFLTRSTNLYDGFPKDCFPFLVPKMLLRGTGASTTAMVGVTVTPQ
ncbi:hypothetical protein CFC21_039390 [Triticum aestivum]|uniref:RING-type E3 ubiquitin transferase n=2 Tax=Triticum aestivum TaxID=4565 RepID=A0A9R1FFD0_WHEAT|nr:putative E3 ubiquitin-protein ligase SINA-like 9 [Triticum aestivum]KAF7027345.1 hypothetical protein CFC21_039390 [Triticum aestivum]